MRLGECESESERERERGRVSMSGRKTTICDNKRIIADIYRREEEEEEEKEREEGGGGGRGRGGSDGGRWGRKKTMKALNRKDDSDEVIK